MAEDKKKRDEPPAEEEPYPDLATALHGEFILFRNELIAPPPKAKGQPEGGTAGSPEAEGKDSHK